MKKQCEWVFIDGWTIRRDQIVAFGSDGNAVNKMRLACGQTHQITSEELGWLERNLAKDVSWTDEDEDEVEV